SSLISWSGWYKLCGVPATGAPRERHEGGRARLVNGSDVDFCARAACGHSRVGPVSGPAGRARLVVGSGGRLLVLGLAAGHAVPPRSLVAPALANRSAQSRWDLGRYRGSGG